MRNHSCPKCQSGMQPGMILVEASGAKTAAYWAEGPIRRSWFWGVKTRAKPIDLVAYRCDRCGLVEHYARP